MFFSCASYKLWDVPSFLVKQVYFDDSGNFVVIASNFSRFLICDENRVCTSEQISSVFTESKITLSDLSRKDTIVFLIFYDLSGKKKLVLEVDFIKREFRNLYDSD
ncbi:MAG: hypothetical protein NZ927_03540 [Candidatus Calescibacterium sp.]|nr:hypothetical protein [Candidatus Calescibacterium sp.]MCX7733544.1 hypothetical protein [bacterium]MDW8087258.1 hypothetical protein [Candidatus Calescibacterium sp.]